MPVTRADGRADRRRPDEGPLHQPRRSGGMTGRGTAPCARRRPPFVPRAGPDPWPGPATPSSWPHPSRASTTARASSGLALSSWRWPVWASPWPSGCVGGQAATRARSTPDRGGRGRWPDHRRLDGSKPAGTDELGRLRRTFNRLLAALDASQEASGQLVLTPPTSCAPRSPACGPTSRCPPAGGAGPSERQVLIERRHWPRWRSSPPWWATWPSWPARSSPTLTPRTCGWTSVVRALERGRTHGARRGVTFNARASSRA